MLKVQELSYAEAVKHLTRLQDEVAEASEELEETEDRVSSLEAEVYSLTRDIDNILDTFPKLKEPNDLTSHLPTPLFLRGYKLTALVYSTETPPSLLQPDAAKSTKTEVILESPHGEIVKQWYHIPNLGELFDQV